MTDQRDFEAQGVAALSNRNYMTAGDAYTRAGWDTLVEPRPGTTPFDIGTKGWVGNGLTSLIVATLCYRVADERATARRRAIEAAAISRDLADRATNPGQTACFTEFTADSHVAGDLSGASEVYDEAREAYETAADTVDDAGAMSVTPLFRAAAAPLKQVARTLANGEIAIEWDDLHGPDPSEPGSFLGARAAYKKRRFPGLLERLVDEGYLAAPRGTTEYATDHHQCPFCDSRDVNWIHEQTLCLRCSRPTDPTG